MFGLPYLAAALAIYFGVRFLSHRRRGSIIRLRDGRRVRLLSSVALLDGSPGDLLALEYFSPLSDDATEDLRSEALGLVQTVGARARYASCRRAVVAVRPGAEHSTDLGSPEHTFTFRRDSGSDWYPADPL